MRYLDANIILRYLTGDDPVKATACYDLFQRLKRRTEQVMTCEAIITEVVYVLSSKKQYHLPHERVRELLSPIISMRGLKLRNKQRYLHALDLYAAYPFLDFEDAVCLAHMSPQGINEILSYDRDFDQLPDVTRHEPSDLDQRI